MELSPELIRYLGWAGVVVIGGLLGLLERRWTRWPWLGLLLLAGFAGGLLVMQVSPFSFCCGSHYMEGVLISGAAALAAIGYLPAYLLAIGWQFARRRLGGGGPPC
jgi:hypothetical protein